MPVTHLSTFALLTGLLVAGPGPLRPASDLREAASVSTILTEVLEREFLVEDRTTDGQDSGPCLDQRFRSVEPLEIDREGRKIFLRIDWRICDYENDEGASRALAAARDEATPDIGLSYAHDRLRVDGPTLYHLHAGCLVSTANFARLVAALEDEMHHPGDAMSCRCGAGCEP